MTAPRVCVVGASGFGAIHVREILRAEGIISGILGSSLETAKKTAAELSEKFSAHINAYNSIDEAISDAPDGVVVACPAQLHADILTAPWQESTKFLCEKPLFWDTRMDLDVLHTKIKEIGERIGSRLAFNCNNLFYLKATGTQKCRHMKMDFFAHSKHKGIDIATDLLPHAVGFAQYVAPSKIEVLSVDKKISDTRTFIECDLGSIACEFHFCNDITVPKRLSFSLDGKEWTRRQDDSSGRCKTFLRDETENEKEIEDPMSSVGKGFVAFLRGEPLSLPDFNFAAENLEICWNILNTKNSAGAVAHE